MTYTLREELDGAAAQLNEVNLANPTAVAFAAGYALSCLENARQILDQQDAEQVVDAEIDQRTPEQERAWHIAIGRTFVQHRYNDAPGAATHLDDNTLAAIGAAAVYAVAAHPATNRCCSSLPPDFTPEAEMRSFLDINSLRRDT